MYGDYVSKSLKEASSTLDVHWRKDDIVIDDYTNYNKALEK